eukprot:scaffold20223_cov64-Attheya_sp.AAC.4
MGTIECRDERREPPPHISISFGSLPLCHSCNNASNFFEAPQWQILTTKTFHLGEGCLFIRGHKPQVHTADRTLNRSQQNTKKVVPLVRGDNFFHY